MSTIPDEYGVPLWHHIAPRCSQPALGGKVRKLFSTIFLDDWVVGGPCWVNWRINIITKIIGCPETSEGKIRQLFSDILIREGVVGALCRVNWSISITKNYWAYVQKPQKATLTKKLLPPKWEALNKANRGWNLVDFGRSFKNLFLLEEGKPASGKFWSK